jgi:hypothetical protein
MHIDAKLLCADADDNTRSRIGTGRKLVVVKAGVWNRRYGGECDLFRRCSSAL